MKRSLGILLFTLFGWLALIPTTVQAYVGLCCAHCGGNMPLNIVGGGIPETHEYRVKISQMFMSMGPFRNGTTDVSTGSLLGIPNGTTQFAVAPSEMRMYMTMLGGAYSFTDDFAVMVMSSYKRNDMDMQFNTPISRNMTGNNPTRSTGFTMQSSGIGDIKALAKYRLYADDTLAPRHQLGIIGGLSLPTGSINRRFTNSPLTGQNGQLLPYKMQLGSGTVDPMIGLSYQGSRDPIWYGFNAWWTGRLYDNDQGYQQGDEARWDLYGMYQFHQKALVHLQINGHWEDSYDGLPGATRVNNNGLVRNPMTGAMVFASPLFDPANYGFTKVNITAGMQYQPFPLHILELTGSVPIHQDVNGPQLKEEYRLMLSYYIEIPTSKSRRFTGTKPPKQLGF